MTSLSNTHVGKKVLIRERGADKPIRAAHVKAISPNGQYACLTSNATSAADETWCDVHQTELLDVLPPGW